MTRLPMREKDFDGWVVDVALTFGWKTWHVPLPAVHTRDKGLVPDPRGAGLPDRVFLHADPPRLILAELKGAEGRLRAEQAEFLRLARDVVGLIREAYAELNDLRDAIHADFEGEEVPIGIYTWRPDDREMIEAILRSKVMVPQ